MSELGTAARRYLDLGWSIIPVGPDKKPLIAWEPFQHRRPLVAELKDWAKLKPVGIALVTGRTSGVCAVDLDKYHKAYDAEKVLEVLPDGIETPTTRTPRGGNHLIFAMPAEELRSRNGLMPGVDLKAEGGYVILPPSRNKAGAYEWIIPPGDARPAAIPDAVLKMHRDLNNSFSLYKADVDGKPQASTTSTNVHKMFVQGRRDEDLFHVAHHLVKSGMPIAEAEQVLKMLAFSCTPPFDPKEISAKIDSAMKRAERRDRNVSAEIREWVLSTSGHWTSTDVHNFLQLSTKEERKAASMALRRLIDDGVIERYGQKNGCFRRVETDLEVLDFTAAPGDEFPIDLPLGLSELVRIYPKNLIVLAGAKDAGKTAFMLDIIKRNIGRYPILYMNSEMGGPELRNRLEKHEGMTLEKWANGMQAVYRAHSWADPIKPERGLYGIDYVEPPEAAIYEVGTILRGIHEKLKDGVAVVCLQKKFGEDLARGGQFTLDKARLYIALDGGGPGRPNRAKIISCKSFRERNPRGLVMDFKLHDGWKIEPLGFWKHE